MRRIVVVALMSVGCLAENPAWRDGNDATSSASTATGSVTAGSTGTTETTIGTGTTTSAGGTGSTGTDTGSIEPQPNVVFITSVPVVAGEIGSVAAADQLCADAAAQGRLAGTYVAWLSDSGTAAISRLGDARGWVRTDGRTVADRVSDLVDGYMWHTIDHDQFGQHIDSSVVATGTSRAGTISTGGTCEDWTNASAASLFQRGDHSRTFPNWTTLTQMNCDSDVRLYCFGADRVAPVTIEPSPGRLAFLSTADVVSTVGVAGFDAVCAQEASSAGLTGEYLAFVATTEDSALSRFDITGLPWVNAAGIPVVENASDLTLSDVQLSAPVQFSAFGTPQGAVEGWTGASRPTAVSLPNENCADWALSAGAARTEFGNERGDWMDNGPGANHCGLQFRVFCFET